MKIFDCFLYCNEDIILDVRLNILNKFVDKFIIVESQYYHNGDFKGLNFNIENFSQFKDKIIYISVLDKPKNILFGELTNYLIVKFITILKLSRMVVGILVI